MDGVQVSKVWVGILAFAGGVFVGIQVAKAYAQNVISTDIHNSVGQIPVVGGVAEAVADKLIVPQ